MSREQDDPINWFSRNDFGASTPITAEINVSHMALIPLQPNVGPTDNLELMLCNHLLFCWGTKAHRCVMWKLRAFMFWDRMSILL
ncbi:hypothetical protein ACSBR1_020931 [Camellia fascicularis]